MNSMLSEAQDAYKLSRAYWELGPARTYLLAAEQAGQKAPDDAAERKALSNRVGRLIQNYERLRLVRHIVRAPDQKPKYADLVPELEDRLKDEFRLRDAVVVDTEDLAHVESSDESDEKATDDKVHVKLGQWSGRILSSLIRPKDVVGVGSGRAVSLTAASCIVPVDQHRPLKIVSLTGSMAVQPWLRDETKPSLDADVIANALGVTLSPTVGTAPIGRRIVETKDKQARQRLKANQRATKLAVIGIGALGGGHRLLRYDPSTVHDELKPAEEKLKRLLNLVKQFEAKVGRPEGVIWHWVGDIANYLFVVEDAPGRFVLNETDRNELQLAVDDLNHCFLNTEPDDLARIAKKGAVLAIAGGRHKLAAIRHALRAFHRNGEPWITHIVTDVWVATQLLGK